MNARLARSNLIVGLIVALSLVACPDPHVIPPPPAPPPSAQTDDPGKLIEGTTKVGDRPAVKLKDGQIFLLERPEDRVLYPTPPDIEPQGFSSSRIHALTLPDHVDLSAFQTPIKNQQSRSTCTNFAATAALEAAIKHRTGREVDLSEQFMAHAQKLNFIATERVLPTAETQVGSWGGGSVSFNLLYLANGFGLPREGTMPYVGLGDFENTDQAGDVPRISNPDTQRAEDDFNLSAQAHEYHIPASTTLSVLPQVALDASVSKVLGVRFAGSGQVSSLDWFRTQLADNREVAFGFNCCGGTDPTPDNGVWNPAPDFTSGGGHAMLMIGYDDRDRTFLIKNSWGDAGFFKFSYDWVTRGLVYEAATILSASGPDEPASTGQLLLGRWNLNFDGHRGLLDIYRIPGSSSITVSGGRADRRLGTFFADDGNAYRVNATITGNKLEFYIDFANPNFAFDARSGTKYTGYLFTRGHLALAGTYANGSSIAAFHATKGAAVNGLPADSFLGTWEINRDGTDGFLTIQSVNASIGTVSGTYRDAAPSSPSLTMTGFFHLGTQVLSFDLPLPTGATSFTSFRYTNDLGLMGGTWSAQGAVGGFYAHRVGALPTISLSRSGFTGSAPLNRDFLIDATLSDPDGAADCCTVTWSPAPVRDEAIGGGRRAHYRFTTAGDKTITATARDATGNEVSASITITVENNPPIATMSLPTTAITVYRGQPVLFRGFATDANEGPGPDPSTLACNRLSWRSSSTSDEGFPFTGSGTAPSCDLSFTFTANGTRSISLVTTDPQGLANVAPPGRLITVVDPPVNLPPSITLGALPPTTFATGYAWNAPIPITASATDPEGNTPISYRWTAISYRPNSATVFAAPTVISNWTTSNGNLNWTPSNNAAMFGTFTDFGNDCYSGQPVKLVIEARDSLGNISSIALPNFTVFRCVLI